MVAETFRVTESKRSALLLDEDGMGHRFARTVNSGGKVRYLAACGELIDPGLLRGRRDFSEVHPRSCEACR